MLESLLKPCIPLPKKLYKRTRRLRTIDEVEENLLARFQGFHRLTLPTRDTNTKEQKENSQTKKRKTIQSIPN